MYLARFSYDVLPVNRRAAMNFIQRELEAARDQGLKARLLVPMTRSLGGAALQFELELTNLDQLDQFRTRGVESEAETGNWMHAPWHCETTPSAQNKSDRPPSWQAAQLAGAR